MNYLVLDDMQERHAFFAEALGVWQPKRAFTASEAKAHLDDYVFDVAFLDHDLELEDKTGTGHDVAIYIARMSVERQPKLCVIHSWNPDGAKRMSATLYDAGVERRVLPFLQPEFKRFMVALIGRQL